MNAAVNNDGNLQTVLVQPDDDELMKLVHREADDMLILSKIIQFFFKLLETMQYLLVVCINLP